MFLQVCGELALKERGKRRFCQTFVLHPQSAKKFYVHDDVFQWLDKAFNEQLPSFGDLSAVEVSSPTQLNGHKSTSSVENVTVDTPKVAAEPEAEVLTVEPETKICNDDLPYANVDVSVEAPKEIAPVPKESDSKSQDVKPKSWVCFIYQPFLM